MPEHPLDDERPGRPGCVRNSLSAGRNPFRRQKIASSEPSPDPTRSAPASPAQIVFDRPHFGRCRRCARLRLEFGHDLRQRRLERCLIGAACDLLLGGRPFEIVHSHAAPHEAELRISPKWLQMSTKQSINFTTYPARTALSALRW